MVYCGHEKSTEIIIAKYPYIVFFLTKCNANNISTGCIPMCCQFITHLSVIQVRNYPRITCNIISVQCHLGEINKKKKYSHLLFYM